MLTKRQQEFCKQYVLCKNGSKACRLSGYSEHTANRISNQLMSKLVIQQEIKRLEEEIQRKYTITKDTLIRDLVQAKELALKADDLANLNRSIETLGKIAGLYRDNVTQFSQLIVKPTSEADMKQKLGDILKKGRGTPTDED